MARYAHAEGYRLSTNGQRVTLLGRGATGRNVLERAASFGWIVDREPVTEGSIHPAPDPRRSGLAIPGVNGSASPLS